VGSVGESYDNALAETIFGLFKAEVIRRNGPWRSIEEVEFATLEWVDWFNNRRLLEPIGDIPPAEFEVVCPGFSGVGLLDSAAVHDAFLCSYSMGVSMPSDEWRRRRLWKISRYSKIAFASSTRVVHRWRSRSSTCMRLQNDSIMALS
jgi:hypothetical protein